MRAILIALFGSMLWSAPPAQVRIPAWVDVGDTTPLKDISVMVDGAPARIVSVRGPEDDLLLLLVLDLSGDLSLVEPAKQALAAEVGKLSPRAVAGVMRAQDGLSVILDPTADREAVTSAIETLPVSGKAGLLDTVGPALSIADTILSKHAVRVAVLYVTDSDIQNYRDDYTNPVINSSDSHDLSRRFPEGLVQEKIKRLDAKLALTQAPLFVVHLKYRSDRLNEAYQNGLKRLVETTAGGSAFCRSVADIPASIAGMFATIQSHYSLGVELPARPGKSVGLRLSFAGNESRGINYRSRLTWK